MKMKMKMTMTAEELVACVRADQNYLITLEKTVEEFKNELVKLKSENSLLHCQVDQLQAGMPPITGINLSDGNLVDVDYFNELESDSEQLKATADELVKLKAEYDEMYREYNLLRQRFEKAEKDTALSLANERIKEYGYVNDI